MRVQKLAIAVTGALFLGGAICVALRYSSRQQARVAEGDSVWRLDYEIAFYAERANGKVSVCLPFDTSRTRLFRQAILHPGVRTEIIVNPRTRGSELIARSLEPGYSLLSAQFDIHVSPKADWRDYQATKGLSTDHRAYYLRSEADIQVKSPAVSSVIKDLRSDNPPQNELLKKTFEFCSATIVGGGDTDPQDASTVLQRGTANSVGRARAMVALCRASKMPTRLVAGFVMNEDDLAAPHIWVEVFAEKRWEPYDPDNGYSGRLPATFVPVSRDRTDIVKASSDVEIQDAYSITRLPPPPGLAGSDGKQWGDIADLTRLPLATQRVLSLLLILPFGALMTALLRSIWGIQTFGTFTPALLALSFIYADWRTGAIIFVTAMIIGLGGRGLLDRLKLLMVPRLSIVLTLVVVCSIFGISALDYLGMTPTARAVLLPMVILTMMVERFYITSEEDSTGFSLRLLAGTLSVGLCCFLLLRWERLGQLVLVYPEIHFFTAGALIGVGRYAGYRLTELWRFRDLVAPPVRGDS